jgi:dTDP-glucose 4,6-dehydratase
MIANALSGNPCPYTGRGKTCATGFYVRDHCSAIDLIMREGRDGEYTT